MDRILKAIDDVKSVVSEWVSAKRTGKVSLHLNLGQGSLINWQIETAETRKE